MHRLIESHPPYLKKPARSTLVSFDWRDRRTPARLPRSNEATGRVTKGQVAQPAYAGFANEVVPIATIHSSHRPLISKKLEKRVDDKNFVISIQNENKKVLKSERRKLQAS